MNGMCWRITRWSLASAVVITLMAGCEGRRRSTQQLTEPAQTVTSDGTPKTRIRTTRSEVPRESRAGRSDTISETAEDASSTEPRLIMSGHVKMSSGIPADGARLTLIRIAGIGARTEPTQTEVASTGTNSEGGYRMAAPDAPWFKLNISRTGAATASFAIMDPEAGGGQERRGVRHLKRDFTLARASSVSGRVENESGAPIAGIVIQAVQAVTERRAAAQTSPRSYESETTSSVDGRFLLDTVPAGEVLLSIQDERFVPLTQITTAPAENVVLKLSDHGGIIEGTVRMLKTEAGVAGATVTAFMVPERPRMALRLPARSAVSAADGNFRVERLPAGKLSVLAAAENLFPASRGRNQLELAEKQTTTGMTLYLYPGTTITGKVTERESGSPLAGAKVSLGYFGIRPGKRDAAETDAEGVYRIGPRESQGTMPISVQLKGYSVYSRQPLHFGTSLMVQTHPDSAETRFDIQMVKATTISGVVELVGGKPAAGASVSLVGSSQMGFPRPDKVLTDSKGAFEIDCSPGREVRVRAEAPGFATGFSDPISVQEKSITGVKVVLKPGGIVTGTVNDPDGNAVEGVEVKAATLVRLGNWSMHDQAGTATSGPRGEFTIMNLAEGSALFTAQKKGYSGARQDVTGIRSGETLSGVTLKLGKSHFIAGKITNEAGKPIKDAHVSCYTRSGSGSGTATSDENGAYRMEDLPGGQYDIDVGSSTYGHARKESVEVDREDVDFVLKKLKAISSTAQTLVTLVGTVVDANTKTPVPDFTVSHYHGGSVQAVMDPNQPGTFTIRGYGEGSSLRLVIESRGYAPLDTGNVRLEGGQETFTKTFELSRGSVLRGRVVAAKGRQPLADVRVSLRGVRETMWDDNLMRTSTASVVTGTDGLFRFEAAAAGSNQVAFRPAGALTDVLRTFQVVTGKEYDAGDVAIESGAVIHGKVVRSPGDAGLAEVLVTLNSGQGAGSAEVRTDADGSFEFRNLTSARYLISVPDYQLVTSVDLTARDEAQVTLRLGGATLKGVVMRGTKPEAARISLSRDGVNLSVTTQGDGIFEIKDLDPGTWHYEVAMTSSWETQIRGDIEVKEGVNERRFDLPAGRISGRVVDSAGSPVESANVSLKRPPQVQGDMAYSGDMTRLTQSDGTFLFDGLREGTHEISASKTGGGYVPKTNVSVPKDGAVPNLELKLVTEGGTLVSIVTNETGQPITDAYCSLYSEDAAVANFNQNSIRDSDGRLEIRGIPPGTWSVHVGAKWFVSANHKVVIATGQTETLTDGLAEAGEFRWALTGLDGAPTPNVQCSLEQTSAEGGPAVFGGGTNQAGIFTIGGIRPGSYVAKATPQRKNPVSVPVTITARQTTTLETKIE